MNQDQKEAFAALTILFAIAIVCGMAPGCAIGSRIGQRDIRDQAITAGVAEYYLDENNNKKFRWKTDKPIPVPE